MFGLAIRSLLRVWLWWVGPLGWRDAWVVGICMPRCLQGNVCSYGGPLVIALRGSGCLWQPQGIGGVVVLSRYKVFGNSWRAGEICNGNNNSQIRAYR